MQRGKYQVPRKARLHGDLRGFEITDFADHDYVRILAQNGSQGAREAHFDPGIDLGLANAIEVVLDGVLYRHDVEGFRVQPRQRGIQRRSLARAGRPGDEDDAVRLANQRIHLRQGRAVHAEARKVEPPGLLVEDAQDHPLAVAGRDRRYADIDRLAGHPQCDAPILWQALFGDVELRHDLHARDNRGMQGTRRLNEIAQRAIDPQPDHRARLERLDMNVGGALPQRLGE